MTQHNTDTTDFETSMWRVFPALFKDKEEYD